MKSDFEIGLDALRARARPAPTDATDQITVRDVTPNTGRTGGFSIFDPGASISYEKNPTPPEPPVNEKASMWSDAGNLVGVGMDDMATALRWATGKILGQSAVDFVDKLGGTNAEKMAQARAERVAKISPQTQAAMQKQFVTETTDKATGETKYGLGDAWTDPRSYFALIMESLPGTVASMGPSAAIARAAAARAFANSLRAGATQMAAAEVAGKVAQRAALVAGGLSEGAISGAQTGQQVEQQIMQMPINVLRTSEAYQELVKLNGGDEDAARRKLANDRAWRGALLAGAVTTAFGGQGDMMLQRIIGGEVKGFFRKIGAGALAEGVFEELPQSLGEQYAQNIAVGAADPRVTPMQGVPNAGISGLMAGAGMGAGFSAAASPFSRERPTPPETGTPLVGGTAPATPPAATVESPPTRAPRTPDADESMPPAPPTPAETPAGALGVSDPYADEAIPRDRGGEPPAPPAPPQRAPRTPDPDETLGSPQWQQVETRQGPSLASQPAPVSLEAYTDDQRPRPRGPIYTPAVGDIAGIGGRPFVSRAVAESRARATNGVILDHPDGGFIVRPGIAEQIQTSRNLPLNQQEGPSLAPTGSEVIPADSGASNTATPSTAETPETNPDVQAAIDEIGQILGVDGAAHEAATSPLNDRPQPTEAQKEAGNYKKGHTTIGGLPVAIENPAGTQRRPEWPELPAHYGYVKGTTGKDGDQVDVFVKPETPQDYAGPVYVIDQQKEKGGFDEHKVMVGYGSQDEAVAAYKSAYTPGWKVGPVTELPWDQFRNWVDNGDHSKPLAPQMREAHSAQFETYRKWIEDGNEVSKGLREQIQMDDRLNDGEAEQLLALIKPKSKIAAEVAAAKDKEAMAQAKAEAAEAIDQLASILGVKKNVTPEQRAQLLPVLSKLMGALLKMGYLEFKAAARKAMEMIRAKLGPDLADGITAVDLRSAYNVVAQDYKGTTSEDDVAKFKTMEQIMSTAETVDEKAGERAYIDAIKDRLVSEYGINSIMEARRLYEESTGRNAVGTDQKRADELLEVAIVETARDIVGKKKGDAKSTYDSLVKLYGLQPNLSTRTSTSVEQQAYSTPAPLAYLAGYLAGAETAKSAYEPTAGNGMLTISAKPGIWVVNELNAERNAALQDQGFKQVTKNDASEWTPEGGNFDVIVENPPFGTVKGPAGYPKTWELPLPEGKTFQTTEVDHAIVMKSLEKMKDDGSAALIVASIPKTVTGESARGDAYNGQNKRRFYYALYKQFNVVDHFTVSGDLYAKQGASWPVDVILIKGRGQSTLPLPSIKPPRIYDTWEGLKGLLDASRLDAGQQGSIRGPAGGTAVGAAGAQPGVVPSGAGPAVAGTRPAGEGSAGGNGPVSGRPGGGGSVAGPHTSAAPPAGGPAVDSGGAAGTTTTAGPAAAGTAQGGTQFAPSGSSAGEGQNGPSGSAAANRGNVAPAAVDETGTNENQLTYHPQSALKSLGTLVPTNQQESVKLALQALADRVGDIDQFVMRELGYKNLGQLGDAFAAEQIDSLALAIDSMQRGSGFIIGDQTGIGKGRVVAGIIKWSLLNGRVPIFTTEKPNLYGDMIRDLSDIGMDDIRPMITNNNESIPIDGVATDYYADHLDAVATAKALGRKAPHMARVGSRPGLWLTAPVKEQNEGRMNAILSGGSNLEALKSAGFNMVFTTYNQMNRDSLKDGRGKPSGQYKDEVRHTFIRTLANGNALILDETHNAGGQKASRGPNQGMAEGRGAFFRQLVDLARSVFYSSATYAKRTDVMDLYSKTDMSKAVNGNVAALPEAIEKGGVPLMQVVSAMLVQAGQYIRRERSFNGVRYDTDQVVVDKVAGENLATTFRMIKDFDILKGAAVAAMDKELKSRGEALGFDNSMGDAGATSTNFTALMHNVVNQMLLALKAKQVVEYAVNALNAGEKPVITLANTMGSFIERYTTDFNLSPGDAVALSFKDVLIRYLKKARDVRIKSPDGKVQVHYLTDDELGPIALAQWKAAEKHIRSAKGLDELPISPIDYLHSELRKLKHPTKNRNVTTGEITGRTHTIEYSATGMKFVMRPESQTNAGARRVLVNQFNNDKVDILILNQAGSTGLSLHSSAKFKNQQPRHMIILQPELNIDTHMQMLGRVHRTGQVVPPRFTQLAADIPAETRPASVLAKKMAALSANTTASRKNALAASNVVDFMNEYGDQVAADLMRDMPDIHQALDEPLTPDTQGYMTDNALAKVTGRLPMLPLADQRRVYDMLESNYKDYLAQKIALGENALEAQTLDLQAKTLEKHTVFSGEVGDESPFSAGAYAELLDVKRLGKPYTWEELRKRISTFLNDNGVTGTSESDPMWRLSNYGHSYMRELRAKVGDEFTAYMTDLIAGMSDPDAIHSTEARLRAAKNVFDRITAEIHPGGQYRIILTDGSSVMAVAMGITRKKDVKLPVAPGAWAVDFAFADASRHIKVPFSQIIVGSADPGARVMGIQVQSATHDPVTRESIEQVFAKGQREVRERRVMLTGNLLAAYGRLPKGQIVNYTDDQGRHLQGILLARDTDIKKLGAEMPVLLTAEQAARYFQVVRGGGAALDTEDGALRIFKEGNEYQLRAKLSKSEGGKYYLNPAIRAITGDWTSRANTMRVEIPQIKGVELFRAINQIGQIVANQSREIAVQVGGSPFKPEADRPAASLRPAKANVVYHGGVLEGEPRSGIFVSTDPEYARKFSSQTGGNVTSFLLAPETRVYPQSFGWQQYRNLFRKDQIFAGYDAVRIVEPNGNPDSLVILNPKVLERDSSASKLREPRHIQPTSEAHMRNVRKQVASFMGQFPKANQLEVEVVARAEDIREDELRSFAGPGSVGIYSPAYGKVVVVAEMVQDAEHLNETLLHEVVGHYGIEALLGTKFAGVISDVMRLGAAKGPVTGNERVGDANFATVEAVRAVYGNLSDAQIAREVLARMAESGVRPTFMEMVYAKIRSALRALGIVRKYTNADLKQMVVDAATYLRTGKVPIGMPGGGPRGFRTIAESKDYKSLMEWFKGSKILDNDGKPLIVYHGTFREFAAFDRMAPATNRSTHATSINAVGSWFTEDPATASRFSGMGEGSRVIPVYVRMTKPLYIDTLDELRTLWTEKAGGDWTFKNGNPDKFRAWLKSQGYDGLSLDAKEVDAVPAIFYLLVLDPATQIRSAYAENFASRLPPAASRLAQEAKAANAAIAVRRDLKGAAQDYWHRAQLLVDPLRTLPDKKHFMVERYLALGEVDRAERMAESIRTVFMDASLTSQKQALYYLTNRDAAPTTIEDRVIREKAVWIKGEISKVADAMLDRGMITEASREKYRDQYLPQLYLKHVLSTETGTRAAGAGRKPSTQGYLKARQYRWTVGPEGDIVVKENSSGRTLTQDEILSLGLIDDPGYLSVVAIAKPMRDMALLDWLAKISTNEQWAHPSSFVRWNGHRVTAHWLLEEAGRIERQSEFYQGENKADALGLAERMKRVAKEGIKAEEAALAGDELLLSYKQIPKTVRYGMLGGMWVRNEIYDDIMGIHDFIPAEHTVVGSLFGYGGIGTKATAWWKMMKVALNVPAQIRNLVSNGVLLQLSGVPLHRVPDVVLRAWREVADGHGPHYDIAKRYGVNAATFTSNELAAIDRDLLKLNERLRDLTTFEKMQAVMEPISKWAGDTYQMAEAIFKTAKIMHVLDQAGWAEMPAGAAKADLEAEAAIQAHEWMFDYSLVSKELRYARNAPVGSPFITFTAKVLPKLVEVALHHPQRFLPWVALFASAPYIVAMMVGADDGEDIDKLTLSMQKWMQERGHIMVLPFRDEDGRWQVVDLGYFLPWSFYTDLVPVSMRTVRRTFEGDFAAAADSLGDDRANTNIMARLMGLIGGPIPDLLVALKTGRDPFTGREISPAGATAGQKVAAWSNYAWDVAMPPMLSSRGTISPMGLLTGLASGEWDYGGKAVQAFRGDTNRWGEPRATPVQAGLQFVGINTTSLDPEQARATNIMQMRRDIESVRLLMIQKLRNQSLSPDERKEILQEGTAEIEKRLKDMQDYLKRSQLPPSMLVQKQPANATR